MDTIQRVWARSGIVHANHRIDIALPGLIEQFIFQFELFSLFAASVEKLVVVVESTAEEAKWTSNPNEK